MSEKKVYICQYCTRQAVTRTKGIWRCPEHQQELRHRQSQSAKQTRCPCGNHAGQGNTLCGACLAKELDSQVALSRQQREIYHIAGFQTIEDIKQYLMEKVRQGEL